MIRKCTPQLLNMDSEARSLASWASALHRMRTHGAILHTRHKNPLCSWGSMLLTVIKVLREFGVTDVVQHGAKHNDFASTHKHVLFLGPNPPVREGDIWLNTENSPRGSPKHVLILHWDMYIVQRLNRAGNLCVWFPTVWCSVPRIRAEDMSGAQPGHVMFAGGYHVEGRSRLVRDIRSRDDMSITLVDKKNVDEIHAMILENGVGAVLEMPWAPTINISPARFSFTCGPGIPMMVVSDIKSAGHTEEWLRIMPPIQRYPDDRVLTAAELAALQKASRVWWSSLHRHGVGSYFADVTRAAHFHMIRDYPKFGPLA